MVRKYKCIVIGLDESYTRTGISICADGQLKAITSEAFSGCKNKCQKRLCLKQRLEGIITKCQSRAEEVKIIVERVRIFSQGRQWNNGNNVDGSFMSIAYIKCTCMLIGMIIDVAYQHKVHVYSVDTRSWKAQVVGTSKHKTNNKKLETIKFICNKGYTNKIRTKNRKGKFVYNDDAADSACIALYGFIPRSRQSLLLEV